LNEIFEVIKLAFELVALEQLSKLLAASCAVAKGARKTRPFHLAVTSEIPIKHSRVISMIGV
jgi:hypothetical protein